MPVSDRPKQIQLLVEMDILPITSIQKKLSSVARNDIVLHGIEFFCDLGWFQTNHKISNQIQIKSHVF